MFNYTLDQVSKLGDKDEKYGQRYWCSAQEDDLPISFNSMEDIELTDAPIKITAEERVEKESKKGTLYHQLRKVKVVGDTQTIGSTNTTTPQSSFEKTVLERLDTLTAMITDMGGKSQQKPPEDPIIEDVPEQTDLADIPWGENEAQARTKNVT